MEEEQSKTQPVELAIEKELTEQQVEKLIAVFSPISLVKYPYFVSIGRRNRQREIHYEETIRDGTKVKWRVKSPDYLPGEMEFKVWCWILQKVSEARKPLPPDFLIPYTLTEIAKYWDMPHGGSSRVVISKAIENLQDTSIHHWVQKNGERPEDLAYSLLAGRAGQGDNGDEDILDKNAIFLDPVLIRLLNKGSIKPSSLEQIKSLADTNLIAARLYELLGWKFYLARTNGKKTVSFMYLELINRIGLRQEKYESQANDQLFKAHRFLKEKNIIVNSPAWEECETDWKIIYTPAKNLILEIDKWDAGKKNRQLVEQLEYNGSEVGYALEEITDYLGKDEKKVFQRLVGKVFGKHKDGAEMIRRAISEAKQEAAGGKVKNKAAYLTVILKKYAK